MQRIRVLYAKTQPLRYTSNLDMHKIWERLLRRAALPLAYNQGFNPQPRLNQAAPLPLGLLSESEVVDFWLYEPKPLPVVEQILHEFAQPGIQVKNVSEIDMTSPALQTQTSSSEYLAELLDSTDNAVYSNLDQRISILLASSSLLRQRRNKEYDLRPIILDLKQNCLSNSGYIQIWMHLTARNSATGRPDEVLLALGVDPFNARITRKKLHFL
jgi:radical SAM-linked protein